MDLKQIEDNIMKYWQDKKIYFKVKQKNQNKQKFYYIDGPPYTTGAIHIGHAWGKALRDSILRFKRMNGFDVWDQPGFDMHGLPIEVAVEKELGIKNKQEIYDKIGMDNFIKQCKNFALKQMNPMIEDFKRLGVWMDWDNPYMTIKNEYIEGAWWALKKAYDKGLMYEGKKSMTWCPRCATALAKHELEYETRKDKSIFVKLPLKDNPNRYLIIWTTTPWTLPFNLGVMVHPDFDYVIAKLSNNEEWIIAEALANPIITGIAEQEYKIIDKFKGSKLEGIHYIPPFFDELTYLKQLSESNKNAFSVLLSSEYVDLTAGSGLVHCAPGCGPEDFEVGKRYGLPAYNEVDENGVFPDSMESLKGLVAKKDDDIFIEKLKQKKLLVGTTIIEHEYAHCWRCKTPVIYRSTDQWFLGVEKLKEDMRKQNQEIKWIPDWAGNKWFDSWLSNLQDWCISRQRFWGIPLPVWKCDKCGKIKIIESKSEVELLANKKIDDLHRPWVDEITFKCECGGTFKRIPDVLDVWLDSGAASWAPLNYPNNKGLFEKLWPADLILEGKDQIRGWFNSMMCLSMVSHGKPPYKAVYMHGFINDAQGRKMSKSLHNIISPYEVIDKYGADTLRYYTICSTKPGLDLNYNFDDMKVKNRNLIILINTTKYLIEQIKLNNLSLDEIKNYDILDSLDEFIISRLNQTIKESTNAFNEYKLNETPLIIEQLFLELSRVYIKAKRDILNSNNKQKINSIAIIYNVLFNSLKLFAPIAPFITEHLYLELKENLGLNIESIHEYEWPDYDKSKIINTDLFYKAEIIIQNTLNLRNQIKINVRWPLKSLYVDKKLEDVVNKYGDYIKKQTNVKNIILEDPDKFTTKTISLDYKAINKDYRKVSPQIISAIMMRGLENLYNKVKQEKEITLDDNGNNYIIKQNYFIYSRKPITNNLAVNDSQNIIVALNLDQDEELLKEGYLRELTRRIQNLRKQNKLNKQDKINLFIQCDDKLRQFIIESNFKDRIGAKNIKFEILNESEDVLSVNIKEFDIRLKIEKID